MNEENALNAGDILEDRYGNKMVIVDIQPSAGEVAECFVLVNGRIKRVNARSPYIIKSYKGKKENVRNG
jgi:hypothetical protein